MRAVVFVKQVPDVRTGSVGTRPDGTIDRSSAAAITNPVDLHALEAALQLADEVVVVSMGPPLAEAAVRDGLAHGADVGILISDRVFAGSDTWATANVLAAAVSHLGGFDIILCGTSALDGETGQVGPQVAERLGIPQATGCEALHVADGRLRARRIVEGGYQEIEMPLPALVTIAETGFTPRYPTLPLRQRSKTAEVAVLTADDLSVSADLAGLEASPTKVARMEMVQIPSLDTRFVGSDLTFEGLVDELSKLGRLQAPDHRPATTTIASSVNESPRAPSAGDAAIWVACELTDGRLAAVSAELLTEARGLADQLGGGVAAFVGGVDLGSAIADAGHFGADIVMVAESEALEPYRCLPFTRVLADALDKHRPQVVLMGATSAGRDLAARVAARLGTGLAADCTGLHIDDWSRRGEVFENLLHQVRPAMGASVLATCVCPSARPQMATVRPGVFPAVPDSCASRVREVEVNLDASDLVVHVVENSVRRGDISLREASTIVAGGAGCTAERWHLVEELAAQLGGRVAASRAAVEAGLAPRARQVGQTGATVRPELYVACGISGAFQHVVGMRGARTVLAINRDPDAAIFRFAHFGIVGDVTEVLPRLTAALGRRASV